MKVHGEKPILELLVQTRPDEVVELESELGHVKMIPFSGTVSGALFQGVIEPCGVDTQVTDAAGVRHMSARYMLTGTDYMGASCHIYVENDASASGHAESFVRGGRQNLAYFSLENGIGGAVLMDGKPYGGDSARSV